jgi:heptosyltransferase-2
VKKFLVIQTAFVGDVILATAVLEELHRSNPDASIDVLVRKGNESLFDGHPFLRRVLVWDKKQKKYAHLFKLLNSVRSEQYDTVVNLQRYTASAFLTAFSHAKQRIGFASNAFSVLYTQKKTHRLGRHGEAQWQHEVQRCLSLIEHLSPNASAHPKLYPSTSDASFVQQYCSEPFITISPASVWFTKQTPLHVWKSLIERSAEIKIFLLGGPGDVALCEQLAGSRSHVQVLAGKLSLLQSAALMAKARMNFTNDSAPLHLCSAVNAPVTAVFCSTIPEFGFGPLSENSAIIQSPEWPDCKPCGIHGRAQCPKGLFQCGAIDVNQLVLRVK